MKSNLFLRSFLISFVLICCLAFGFFGITKAYKNIRLVAYGEYVSAIELKDGILKILDIKIEL